jgi:hypothetical protein
MDRRRICEAATGSIMEAFSKLILSADMSDIRLSMDGIKWLLVFSTDTASSKDSKSPIEGLSMDGLFEPRRMYFRRLSVDCKHESDCIVLTALGGKLYLHALLNETAFFGVSFAVPWVKSGANVALITVIV